MHPDRRIASRHRHDASARSAASRSLPRHYGHSYHLVDKFEGDYRFGSCLLPTTTIILGPSHPEERSPSSVGSRDLKTRLHNPETHCGQLVGGLLDWLNPRTAGSLPSSSLVLSSASADNTFLSPRTILSTFA